MFNLFCLTAEYKSLNDMKKLNLSFTELTNQELKKVNGGLKISLLIGTLDTAAKDKWTWFWEKI